MHELVSADLGAIDVSVSFIERKLEEIKNVQKWQCFSDTPDAYWRLKAMTEEFRMDLKELRQAIENIANDK